MEGRGLRVERGLKFVARYIGWGVNWLAVGVGKAVCLDAVKPG